MEIVIETKNLIKELNLNWEYLTHQNNRGTI